MGEPEGPRYEWPDDDPVNEWLDTERFLLTMFLQDLHMRCDQEVRALWDSGASPEEVFAQVEKHKFSFKSFLKEWRSRQRGRPRKYDRQTLAQMYWTWHARNPNKPDADFIRKAMSARDDREVRKCRRALNDACKDFPEASFQI